MRGARSSRHRGTHARGAARPWRAPPAVAFTAPPRHAVGGPGGVMRCASGAGSQEWGGRVSHPCGGGKPPRGGAEGVEAGVAEPAPPDHGDGGERDGGGERPQDEARQVDELGAGQDRPAVLGDQAYELVLAVDLREGRGQGDTPALEEPFGEIGPLGGVRVAAWRRTAPRPRARRAAPRAGLRAGGRRGGVRPCARTGRGGGPDGRRRPGRGPRPGRRRRPGAR